MDTLDILGYFKKITKCIPSAQYAVVPSDKLNDIIVNSYPFMVCVNLDESSKKGSHWVCMYIARRGAEVEFFDSYGISINKYPPYFFEFARKQSPKVIERNVMLQSPTSYVCGHYVIMYVYNRLRGCSVDVFYKKFSNDLAKNDTLVYNFVSKIFIKKPISCKYFQVCNKYI